MKTTIALLLSAATCHGYTYTFHDLIGPDLSSDKTVQQTSYELGYGPNSGEDLTYNLFSVFLGTHSFFDVLGHGGTFTLSPDRTELFMQSYSFGGSAFSGSFWTDASGLCDWRVWYWSNGSLTNETGTGVFLRSDVVFDPHFYLPTIQATESASVPDGGSTGALLGLALVALAGWRRRP